MLKLDLAEQQMWEGAPLPPKAKLIEKEKDALRSIALLQDPNFIAWRKQVEAGIAKQIRKLVEKDDEKKRGMIQGVERLFSELELKASSLERIRLQLEEHEQRDKQPVVRDIWDWDFRALGRR